MRRNETAPANPYRELGLATFGAVRAEVELVVNRETAAAASLMRRQDIELAVFKIAAESKTISFLGMQFRVRQHEVGRRPLLAAHGFELPEGKGSQDERGQSYRDGLL